MPCLLFLAKDFLLASGFMVDSEIKSNKFIKNCVICNCSYQSKSQRRLTCSRECHVRLVKLRVDKQKALGLKTMPVKGIANNFKNQ